MKLTQVYFTRKDGGKHPVTHAQYLIIKAAMREEACEAGIVRFLEGRMKPSDWHFIRRFVLDLWRPELIGQLAFFREFTVCNSLTEYLSQWPKELVMQHIQERIVEVK